MKTERFHLGAVLSMTTGKLLCQMDDIYRIAQHLGGGPVWTHQLPRVMTESRPHLLAQFPALASVTGEDVTRENVAAWLCERVSDHGEWFDVAPMPERAMLEPAAANYATAAEECGMPSGSRQKSEGE